MVRRRVGILFCFLLTALTMQAQNLSDKYYEENPQGLFDELFEVGDTLLYYRPSSRMSTYDRFSRFSFRYIAGSPRGEHYSRESVRLGTLSLTSPLDEWCDYGLLAALRRVPMKSGYEAYTDGAMVEADLRSEWFAPSPSLVEEGHNVRLYYAERNYRLGAHYSSVGALNKEWRYSLAVGGRSGRDARVEGVFAREGYLWLAAERGHTSESIYGDMHHRMLVAMVVAPRMRSMRSWNTEECFDLVSNRLYNSSWGYQQGRVRSARVRRDVVPTLYGSYSLEDEYGIVGGSISAMVSGGHRSSSGLDWSEAMSPLPDYRGYLPSGYDDPELALEAERVWLSGDSRYTQIDWNKLYTINALSQRGGVYALMEDCTDLFSAQINISGGEGGRRIGDGGDVVVAEGLSSGLTLGYHSQRLYNRPADLLGASALAEGYDLYDYSLAHLGAQLYQNYYTSGDYGALAVSALLGTSQILYRERRQVEWPAERRLRDLNEARVKLAWNYHLGPQAKLAAVFHYHLRTPHHSNLLASPEEAVVVNPYARGEHNVGADVRGEWRIRRWKLAASLYASYTAGESRVEQFWNDLSDDYVALMAGGLDALRVGVELEARWYISHSWSVEGVLGIGSHSYTSNGVADIVRTATGESLVEATRLATKGTSTDSTPQVMAAVKATWRGARGWSLSVEGDVAGGRIVPSSLLYTSDYLLRRGLSPEEREAFVAGRNLGVAPNVSAMVMRRMGSVNVSLAVRNVLNSSYIYGAFRPSRVEVVESDHTLMHSPHGDKLQYGYPRNIYITIGYDF